MAMLAEAGAGGITQFDEVEHGFDQEMFHHFGPLLHACEPYAQRSGFRFLSRSFSDVDGLRTRIASSPAEADDARAAEAATLAAVVQAEPAVRVFSERVLAQEPELVEELDRAFRVVMLESVRNAMISTCRALEVFAPPGPAPNSVDPTDCAFEDTSVSLEVIAQRLYNDEMRRRAGIPGGMNAVAPPAHGGAAEDESEGAAASIRLGSRLLRRARTASFLVDFAREAGAPLPKMPEAYEAMLQEFASRAAEWAAPRGLSAQTHARHVVQAALNKVGSEQGRRELWNEVQKFREEHRKAFLAASFAASVVVTPVAVVAAASAVALAPALIGFTMLGAAGRAVAVASGFRRL
jgi:hypothetical protein